MEHITSSVHLFMKETAAEWAATMIETRGIPNMSRKYEYHRCLWRVLVLALLKSFTCRRMTGARATCLCNIILIIWHFRPNLLGVAKREIMTGACKYVQTFGIFVTKSMLHQRKSFVSPPGWMIASQDPDVGNFLGKKRFVKSPILGCKTVFSSTN